MKKKIHISLLFLITLVFVLSLDRAGQKQPVPPSNELIKNQSRDIVIYSSCLFFAYKSYSSGSNKIVNKEYNEMGLITGENTRNFFKDPISYINREGAVKVVNQAGGTGIVLIRPDFEFTKFSGKKSAKSHTISVSQKTDG